MGCCGKDHENSSKEQSGGFFRSRSGIIFILFLGIAGFFLWTEHRAHLFSFLPFLLLLACPIMHLFHHGGHGGHRHDGEQEDNRAQHSGCGSHHRNPETALAQTQPSIETKGTLS